MRKILLTLAVLLAASCGSDDGGDGAVRDTEAADTTGTTAAADPAGTTTSTPDDPAGTTGTTEPAEADGPIVLLEAGGLGVVTDSESGSTTRLIFGEASQDDTVTALTAALGDVVEENDLTECGEGPLHSVQFASLAAYFADGVFGGWHLRPTGPIVLTTAGGIGIGSTRAELEDAFADVSVDETSLGIEFSVGTGDGPYLSGTLVDDAPDGEIDAMWSGMTCIAR